MVGRTLNRPFSSLQIDLEEQVVGSLELLPGTALGEDCTKGVSVLGLEMSSGGISNQSPRCAGRVGPHQAVGEHHPSPASVNRWPWGGPLQPPVCVLALACGPRALGQEEKQLLGPCRCSVERVVSCSRKPDHTSASVSLNSSNFGRGRSVGGGGGSCPGRRKGWWGGAVLPASRRKAPQSPALRQGLREGKQGAACPQQRGLQCFT